MKMIKAYAHILTDEGTNASGLSADLEAYTLSSRRWNKMGTAKTNANGLWQLSISNAQQSGKYAPMLRLVETGTPAPRVLAQGGYIRYTPAQQLLTVDFGQLERLEETAYALKTSNAIFNRSKLTIAGHAKKASISITGLFREGLLGTSGRIPPGISTTGTSTVSTAEISGLERSRVLETFDAEIIKFKAREANLQSIISTKDLQLSTRNEELSLVKNRAKELEQKLSVSKAKEEELQQKNKSYVAEASKKVPIESIAASIGTQVDNANQKLIKNKSPYRFGRIEVNLRGSVSSDGKSMALASLVDIKDLTVATSLPGMKVEILPDRIPEEVSTDVKVPNVIGLTETAARRLLQAVGLRMEKVGKSLKAGQKIPIGQSIQQSPVAGEALSRGEPVLVVFAIGDLQKDEV